LAGEALWHLSSAKHQDSDDFLTGDESWFDLNDDHERIWLHCNDAPPVSEKTIASSPKVMLTVFWSGKGFLD
jgi:hypothetical protein